jgi:hypothetical protein
MKLRNKRTGDIWEFDLISMKIADTTLEKLKAKGFSGSCCARSLAELNEEWEDLKPAEPLIKDEKIRKAVRVWADASGITKVLSYGDIFWIGFRSTNTESVWKFECNYIDGPEFQQDKEYTIAELCGEEEE